MAQTNASAAAGTPRMGARSTHSTGSQETDADARGDPDSPGRSTMTGTAGDDITGNHPAPSSATPIAADPEPDQQSAEPEPRADAQQSQHTTPVAPGPGEESDAPAAVGEEPEQLDQDGYLIALMDVADRAFQYADEAATGAERALSRSSARNEERLEAVMRAAHAQWLDAEHHHGGAKQAHADGEESRLAYHASKAISAAVKTQRAAGVATTADALREELEGLKLAKEPAQETEARAQVQAMLDKLHAELERELTAVTRMDAANRDLLDSARWRAESAVPELGWWPAVAADMTHAHQGRLWLDETGAPHLVKHTADGHVVAGRKVNAERVAMLRAAGFLVTGSDGETSTLLHPSDMGREALYLATLYPEGLHEDERAAYEARYEASRKSWMNNEERKSAARRLPPLDPHTMRAIREKPELLDDGQIPQIDAEAAARHAGIAELAQRLWNWAAMSRGEQSAVIEAPATAADAPQKPEEMAGGRGRDAGGAEHTATAPPSELPPTPGQDFPRAATPFSTTTAGTQVDGTSDLPAADAAPLPPRSQEVGDDPVGPEGWSADVPSGLTEAPAVASWDDHEAPAALMKTPGPLEDPAADTLQPSVREQTELFSVPTPTQASTAASGTTAAEPEEKLPRYSLERHRVLDDIARGSITEVDGQFMQRVPRRSVRLASSPQRISALLDEGLAERAGTQIQLSDRGYAWYNRYSLTMPGVPRDIETVAQASLPPIDYAPLADLPMPAESGKVPHPPAPAPLQADWHKTGSRSRKEIDETYAMAARAAARAARSTARDVADLAAGPDREHWIHQHPLAQYDENAAAALEALTDSVTHEYAARAVLNLRAALEQAGKEATDYYVQNVRSPQWKTARGIQADDIHRVRVRGIVITYLYSIRDHATKYGLDADAIIHVLEDAAGWAGALVPLGDKAVEFPQLPAAEYVAEAAQYVANKLRAYALGETDTVDTVASRRAAWRALEPRPVPSAPTRDAADPGPAGVSPVDVQARSGPAAPGPAGPAAAPSTSASAPVDDSGPHTPLDGGPRDVEEEPPTSPSTGIAGSEVTSTSPPEESTGGQERGRQGQAGDVQASSTDTVLTQSAPVAGDDAGPPETAHSVAPADASKPEIGPMPQKSEKPVTAAASAETATPTTPGPGAADSARETASDGSVLPDESMSISQADAEAPRSHPAAPAAEASDEDGDRPLSSAHEAGNNPRPRPATVRKESTVATSTPPSAASTTEATVTGRTRTREAQSDLGPPAPYPDAAAYTAAHEALLTELDQHEQWLARTPAAAEAATTLADSRDLGSPGLAALLALQATLAQSLDEDGQREHLAQRLNHHIRCGQMNMARAFFAQAARTSNRDALRHLNERAAEGRFLTLEQQTEDGRLQLGQYLAIRDQQIAQLPEPEGVQNPAEPVPPTAQEATTMVVDQNDDSELPVFEMPGESIMSATEAAPRLLAEAQTRLTAGEPFISLLAFIHGRPVYSMVDQANTPTPVLLFGLTTGEDPENSRAVSIPGHELALVTPERLLTAVTAWLHASDEGGRPLLDYAPSAPAENPAPLTPEQRTTTPAQTQHPAATATAPLAPVPQTPAEPAQPPASNASENPTTQETRTQMTSAGADAPPAGEPPTAPEPGAAPKQAAASTNTGATATEDKTATPPAAAQQHEPDGTQPREATSTATTDPPAPAAEPADQLTELTRSILTDLGVTLGATGVATAERTVVITLEASGDAQRDREIAEQLRPALHEAIRQHPDQRLAAYRVDLQHTPQAGQGTLPAVGVPQGTVVPRERLIAANRAAAQIFAKRLQDDPNAGLSRSYLTEKRRLPAEVQREWGLGYAPSDRSAGRWDVLVNELTDQGFTEAELLHAGLAIRSKRDTLIDAFTDRIMFPIHDENGDIVGFSGRRVDRPGETEEQAKERGGPKYFNTSNNADLFNKGDLVFGLHHPVQAQALAQSSGPRVSVEGYLDVIAVARAAATVPIEQRPVVGAPMGTAFTERQLTLLRGLDTDNPRPHIAFLDADESGRKVLLDKWDLLVKAAGPTTVTTAPDAKDAAKLWEEGIEASGDGATPVLHALEQQQPLLEAAVEAVLLKNADDAERANHVFSFATFSPRARFIADEAARYIHQAVQTQAPGDATALQHAALTWAKRLDQEWGIPGPMTATAVLLGPRKQFEDEEYEDEVYEHALDLLAADPEGYFANDPHVRSRESAWATPSSPETGEKAAEGRRPGQWPAGTRASEPAPPTSAPVNEPVPDPGELLLRMTLPSPVDGRPVEYTDRATAAYALHVAVYDRLGQHTSESPEPDRLPQPLKLGTVYGVDLSTSGDDQTGDDPTVVVWLGTARSDSLRMSYRRFVAMSGPELLAAIEWRAAQAAGLLDTPLSQTWRTAVRSILPAAFPAQPTPAQLADLLDMIAQGPDGDQEHTRRRAEQALSAYTAGHPDLTLDLLAADDHIWVLRNDGSWTQEATTQQTWEELDNGFSQEAAELADITRAAAEFPPADETPMAVDLTVAHHSAHEALAALRPYSIGLPGTLYEKITDLVAQMDVGEPALRRLHGPSGEQLMNRAKRCVIRILEGLATVASKIRLAGLGNRLERTVARLRGQDPDENSVPRTVRTDRRMQDLAHIERDLERRMASPTTTLAERGELQEQWIINRARWRARYEQLTGQPPGGAFLPDNGLVAGAPPVPNLIDAHELLLTRLSVRVAELRDTDPHTGEDANPYEPTADLLNGVAWAYQQRLTGIVPTGDDPQGPIPPTQLRQAALTVTAHQNASPLTLRRAMNVTAERADRLLHRLEEQQILGPYRADAPRTVLARVTDIDTLLARPTTPVGPHLLPTATDPAPTAKSPASTAAETAEAEVDDLVMARLRELVSKIIADKETRSVTGGEPDPGDGAAPTSRVRKNLRKTPRKEAEDNALAAGQSTSLAPSQS
ncbi:toprim domain-containing protein [Streptomyces roseolus]|uniref:toprim domain-containing protein n=1 Tax=Streptomyces roseolus TaxID=67358 RepID=UPI00379D91DE